ncbi:FHA domain-containing protein [Actinomadura latina]|uniref:FHA domain-containing protein n=1 Tax=Actinomadura latina TaxID=163603 RepID=A0A846Z650_9ACTN|nr:FHA domain-containing protein [Actinomadura latina]NKZ08890.1 FHA domain-containing protein [Actinomadura latina]
MPICPSGHTSGDADYCDVCGDRIGGAPPAQPVPAETPVCPHCGTPRSGRFCEADGYDFDTGTRYTVELSADRAAHAVPLVPQPRTGGGPVVLPGPYALVAADRAYFDAVAAEMGPDAGGLAFPPYCPERRVPLIGGEIRIGRRSPSRGIVPEIDLSAPPEDPGVSHLHAVLLAQPDGTWNLVDPGSTNGTTVNGATEPIPVNAPLPMADGDRIHVGAWTTITLSLQEGPP